MAVSEGSISGREVSKPGSFWAIRVTTVIRVLALLDAARKGELAERAPYELFGAVGQQCLSIVASDSGRFTRTADLYQTFAHKPYMIGVMVYSFARVGAVVGMSVEDYFQEGKRWWFRLHEKGGKRHEAPAHHNAEAYVDAYLTAAQIADDRKGPLFRSLDRRRRLTERRLHRLEVLAMIKRRARQAELPETTCCHTFRATGITTYLQNGGTIEHAQQIANHESPRTTKLYDRTSDAISLDEIERILI